jgi:Coenzyme PQQ synthesis protein D (PqqD)
VNGDAPVTIARSPRALWRRVGDDAVVMSPGDHLVHHLSGGASAAWAEMEHATTVPDLIERLAVMHGIAPTEIAAQVEGCVDTLLSLGVAEAVGGSDA